MRTRLLLLPAVSALVIGGCSLGTTIDSDKAEDEITKGFEKQVPGAKVKTLSCPDDVDAKKNEKASCDITLSDGKKGKINLVVLNEDGDIRWDVGSLK